VVESSEFEGRGIGETVPADGSPEGGAFGVVVGSGMRHEVDATVVEGKITAEEGTNCAPVTGLFEVVGANVCAPEQAVTVRIASRPSPA